MKEVGKGLLMRWAEMEGNASVDLFVLIVAIGQRPMWAWQSFFHCAQLCGGDFGRYSNTSGVELGFERLSLESRQVQQSRRLSALAIGFVVRSVW